MLLTKGSHVDLGSEHQFITDVLRDGDVIDVLLHRRTTNLLFARPKNANPVGEYLVSFDYALGKRTYVLFNRKTREVIRTQMNGIRRPSWPNSNSRLVQENWEATFWSGPGQPGAHSRLE